MILHKREDWQIKKTRGGSTMNKKKFLALAFALVLALGLLSGCGGGEKPSGSGASGGGSQSSSGGEPAAAKVELTVVTSYGGDDGNRKNYENAVPPMRPPSETPSWMPLPPPTRSGRPRYLPTSRPAPSRTSSSSSPTPTPSPSSRRARWWTSPPSGWPIPATPTTCGIP